MPLEEIVTAHGHEHVTADHESTFEVTTDDYLTPSGDCILGIEADRAPADFDSDFVDACRDEDATITAHIAVGSVSEHITGRGDPRLSFESQRSLVGRTSTYVDDRTVLVDGDRAAADLHRDVVSELEAGAGLTLRLVVS
ncbi:MAG: DUF371 domain-containing protein [Halodesulfurarchaeum sp.]